MLSKALRIMIILVIVFYGILIIYEFVPLFREKKWKDFIINAILSFFSLTVAILLCLDVKMPSTQPLIQKLVSSLFER